MASKKDPAAMTVDELDEISIELKGKINALRDERREYKRVRDRKVLIEAVARQNKVDPNDLTEEEIEVLIGLAERTVPYRGDGDVSVAPGGSNLKLRGEQPEVD